MRKTGKGNSKMRFSNYLAGLLFVVVGMLAAGVVLGAARPASSAAPTLINTCLITGDVNRLVNFYESVLRMKAERSGQEYAEFRTGVGVLAIFSADAKKK